MLCTHSLHSSFSQCLYLNLNCTVDQNPSLQSHQQFQVKPTYVWPRNTYLGTCQLHVNPFQSLQITSLLHVSSELCLMK